LREDEVCEDGVLARFDQAAAGLGQGEEPERRVGVVLVGRRRHALGPRQRGKFSQAWRHLRSLVREVETSNPG
jgi:hypothetical protein